MHSCRVLKCDIADGGCRFPTPGIWAALGPTSRHCHLTLADPGIAIQNLGVFGVLRHVLAQKCNCQPLSRLWPTAVIVQVQTFPCLIRGRTLIQRLDDGQWMRSVKKNEQIAWSNVLWQASVCSWSASAQVQIFTVPYATHVHKHAHSWQGCVRAVEI